MISSNTTNHLATNKKPRPARLAIGVLGLAFALLSMSCGNNTSTSTSTTADGATSTETQASATTGDSEKPTTTATSSSQTSTESQSASSDTYLGLAANTIVLQLNESDGFVPEQYVWSRFPSLTIFADGTLISGNPGWMDDPGSLLPKVQSGKVDVSQITELVEAASASGVFEGENGADFGSPMISDANSTLVSAYLDGSLKQISIYAFGFETEVAQPEDLDGMGINKQAHENRLKVASLIENFNNTASAVPQSTYLGAGYRLFAIPSDQTFVDEGPTREWPNITKPTLEAPDAFGCMVLSGQELEIFAEAASDANVSSTWNIDGNSYVVAVAPLIDPVTGCN